MTALKPIAVQGDAVPGALGKVPPTPLTAPREKLALQLAPARWSLGAKLAVAMTTLAVVAVALVTLLSVQREQAVFRTELEQQAGLTLNTLRAASVNALYRLDVDSLVAITQYLDDGDYDIAGRFYDTDGRLLADTDLDIGFAFRLEADPFGARLIESDVPLYEYQPSALLAGQTVIIGRQIVGAISVTLPTTALQGKIENARNQGIIAGVFAAFISALLAFIIARSITNPLRELTRATVRISEGDLTYAITPRTGDELATLAVSFEIMRTRLQSLVQSLQQRANDLQIANEKVQEASRVKSEFLATMSHELRTPLNAIIGFSDMLLMGMNGALTEKQGHKIERLQDNGKRLLSLVNDILDIARIEAGRIELNRQPFNPESLAQRLGAQMAVLADKKDLAFEVKVDPKLPAQLVGDAQHIEQVVVNLISNAIKFTETGTVTLAMDAQLERNMWTIVVKDTGIGIPPHALDLIFEPFRQVDGSSTRAFKGSGLGLAITLHLVRVMDGTIKVESTLGSGTTFTVTMPIVQSLPADGNVTVLSATSNTALLDKAIPVATQAVVESEHHA